MRIALVGLSVAALMFCGCSRGRGTVATSNPGPASQTAPAAATGERGASGAMAGGYLGFDRNQYPGDETMAAMRKTFAFTGYWLTNPPGENANSWVGKRAALRQQGWGFLALANGRLDAEILKARKSGTSPTALARKDAELAVRAARAEGFPIHTILFLDQEEGGRLLAEQAAYLFGWTEAVAASDYLPGIYASGQPVPEGPAKSITTIDDVRSQVKAARRHEIAMFAAQDACPPAPGCTVHAKPLAASGEMDLTAWQYAQSPRRPEITTACAATYAADGNCYAQGFPGTFLDMDIASSADPSHGR